MHKAYTIEPNYSELDGSYVGSTARAGAGGMEITFDSHADQNEAFANESQFSPDDYFTNLSSLHPQFSDALDHAANHGRGDMVISLQQAVKAGDDFEINRRAEELLNLYEQGSLYSEEETYEEVDDDTFEESEDDDSDDVEIDSEIVEAIFEAVGGEERYEELLEYASENAPQQFQNDFNALIQLIADEEATDEHIEIFGNMLDMLSSNFEEEYETY